MTDDEVRNARYRQLPYLHAVLQNPAVAFTLLRLRHCVSAAFLSNVVRLSLQD